MPPKLPRPLAVLITAVVLLVACSSGDDSSDTTEGTAPTTAAITPTADEPSGIYLSLGDSYADGDGASEPSRSYAALLPERLEDRGYDLDVVDLACRGARVADLVHGTACPDETDRIDITPFEGRSQIDAALDLMAVEPGLVRVITITIGGNDITSCVESDDPIDCVVDGVAMISQQLGPSLQRLREAAGYDTVIIGLTYPDVILGEWLNDDNRELAELSVTAFRDFINPALASAYAEIDAQFVDVTDATDAYVPLDQTVDTDDHGEIPVAVARICELTWYCENADIHPNDDGYDLIADLIAEVVPAA